MNLFSRHHSYLLPAQADLSSSYPGGRLENATTTEVPRWASLDILTRPHATNRHVNRSLSLAHVSSDTRHPNRRLTSLTLIVGICDHQAKIPHCPLQSGALLKHRPSRILSISYPTQRPQYASVPNVQLGLHCITLTHARKGFVSFTSTLDLPPLQGHPITNLRRSRTKGLSAGACAWLCNEEESQDEVTGYGGSAEVGHGHCSWLLGHCLPRLDA